MTPFRLLVSLVASLLFSMSQATAHPGGHGSEDSAGSRAWTIAATGTHVHGTFVAVAEGRVQLRRDDGSLSSLSIDWLSETDRNWVNERMAEIERINSRPVQILAQRDNEPAKPRPGTNKSADAPVIRQHFRPFDESLQLRWDDRYFYVESNGLPDHPMMIGIRAWQQQVPLPQNYTGDNAWRIPLHPVPARQPMSARSNFFRGAIALAVNGVPIFNPIKKDGRTDTFLAGELDQYGGHCGRGDDYHYHLPPVHLEKVVGEGEPIAYALDGYPIYGYQQASDPDFAALDGLNGHKDAQGRYHYHATQEYPYLNGGFYGEVTERDGQVDPQPRANPVRPALPPLRGATVTGFDRSQDGNTFTVEFHYRGEARSIRYTLDGQESVAFTFNDGSDGRRTETYPLQAEPRRGPPPRRPGDRPPPRPDDRPPPRRDGRGADASSAITPPAEAVQRRPWIAVHASEMDADGDGQLSRTEVLAEAARAFAGYDPDETGKVSLELLRSSRPVRSAMGGFIREHSEELDRNRDGVVTGDEVSANAARMFDKADTDRDGLVSIDAALDSQPGRDSAKSRSSVDDVSTKPTVDGDRPPNIVLILVDDLGWRDVGFAGNEFVETPHIDRLATDGVAFTQAYSSGPNCAPTRASLMSGQYTPRHGVFTVVDSRHNPVQPQHRILSSPSREELAGDVVTIAELLQQQGYATACFGMWNLGRGRSGPTAPMGQGFDIYRRPQDLGFEQHAYFDADGRYLTDALFDSGLGFIEQHGEQPFFLYLPTHAVHAPLDPPPRLVEKYRRKQTVAGAVSADPAYAATIEALDSNVGRLWDTLRSENLIEQTLIIFTSDNGGTPHYVAPLNGSKGALYEGGIRVPCAVWWSGIHQPGRQCDCPILTMDWYATLADLAGARLPKEQPIDGVSLLPILRGADALSRDALYWHFPCYIGRGEPCSAIRIGDWKLIQKFEDDTLELFNLDDDPGEARNLAKQNPDVATNLADRLDDWQTELNAPRPREPNPAYDPATVRRRGRSARAQKK